jgi:hypothetical protein
MNTKQLTLSLGALVGLGAVALAHHVPVELSFLQGKEILTGVVYQMNAPNPGIPAYRVGSGEIDEHHGMALGHGDSFSVSDGSGAVDTVVFDAADFADIGDVQVHDVVAAINAKATLFEAFEDNAYMVFRALNGGQSSTLATTDGIGAPLSKLQIPNGTSQGTDEVRLVISTPEDTSFELHPYLVIASTTLGDTPLGNDTLHVLPDDTTALFAQLTRLGVLPGFAGFLDANGDAEAVVSGSSIQRLYGVTAPDALHFSYLVLSKDGSAVELVSNAFTVDFQ